MRKLLVALVALALSSSLCAAPKFSEADAMRQEIRNAMEGNTGALLKPAETFPQRGKQLTSIVSKAEKLFGDPLGAFGPCVKAAYAARDVWQSQMAVTRPNGTVADLNGLVQQAYLGGQEYVACRALVDALETPKRK